MTASPCASTTGRQVKVDLKTYAHIDHGYAATVHKTQGMTVDRTHVLATPGLDAHATYVALSRHRDGTALHYGRDDFADDSPAPPHAVARAAEGYGDGLMSPQHAQPRQSVASRVAGAKPGNR